MNKKLIKRLAIALGSILGVVLLVNFGINLWIKYKLPDYLKNNTNYAIEYEKLEIDLATGNIFANDISIQNKKNNNPNILGIKGSVDTLRVNSFGILDLIFRKEISISDAELVNPKISMVLPQKKQTSEQKEKKPFSMKHLQIKNGEIEILQNQEHKVFSATQLNLLVDDFLLSNGVENTALPFQMSNFSVNGRDIFFQNKEYQAEASVLVFENNAGNLSNLKLIPKTSIKNKTKVETALKSLTFLLNTWKISDKKIHLDFQKIDIDGLDTKVNAFAQKNKPTKKSEISVDIKNIDIKNSNFNVVKNNQPMLIQGFNGNFSDIKMDNAQSGKMKIQMANYKVSMQEIAYTMPFYTLNASQLSLSPKEISTQNFKLKPRYSRSEFVRKIPTEKDLFDLEYQSLKLVGKWDFLSEKTFLDAQKLAINGLKANIFRSKLLPDDRTRKPMYSELLRGIKLPLYIKQIDVLNSHLEYEEDTPKSKGAGKLTFSDFNMKIQHLNSAKMKGKPTKIPVDIDCKFLATSPMKVHWVLDTQSMDDTFHISGNIQQLSAQRINTFVEPYLNIRTAGNIQNLQFDFKGNKNGIGGDFKLKHKDLKVSLLNQEGEKKKFLSAVVNMVIKNDSKKYPESVKVERVPRDNTKSFFNLFWKGIESGLVNTLVGKTAENIRSDLKSS